MVMNNGGTAAAATSSSSEEPFTTTRVPHEHQRTDKGRFQKSKKRYEQVDDQADDDVEAAACYSAYQSQTVKRNHLQNE